MPDGPVVAIIVLAIGGLLAVAYFVYDHQRHRRDSGRAVTRSAERLPLFGTDLLPTRGADGAIHLGDDEAEASDDEAPAAPRRPPVRRPFPLAGPTQPAAPLTAASGTAPVGGSEWGPPAGRANGNGAHTPATPAYSQPATGPAAPAFTRAAATGVGSVAPAPVGDPAIANGETLRFALPDEGTLRFLPGRLEVVAGADAGREIRFVAPPGAGDAVEITFGRNEGPPYRHVQLLARTVSRRHAVMALTDGHWSLQNLSATNPVLLNGRPLAADEVAPLLVDGDRIEMGEVVFTFHAR